MNKQPDCHVCGTGSGLCPQHVTMAEKVNHPSHYGGDTTYEHIKVVEAWGVHWPKGMHYALGSATKYICRISEKGAILENLKKARFWIEHEIKRLEEHLLNHPFEERRHSLNHPFDGSDNVDRCAHEFSPGVYCEEPVSRHPAVFHVPPREATCEELDCDETGHSPYCQKFKG